MHGFSRHTLLANTMNPWKLFKDHIVIGKKIDETFYAVALDEFLSGQLRGGLMAKAIAQSGGDEQKAKAIYIRLLADAIRDDHYLLQRANEESSRIQQQADENLKQDLARRAEQAEAKNEGCGVLFGLNIIILFVAAAMWLLSSNEESTPIVAAPPPAQSQNTYAPSNYDKLLMSYERQYPQINPASPHFDKRLTDQIAKRMSTYRASGHSDDDALKLAVSDFFSNNASQSKNPGSNNVSQNKSLGSYSASQSKSLGSHNASQRCEIKPVMTDEDYRRCGITPPGAR